MSLSLESSDEELDELLALLVSSDEELGSELEDEDELLEELLLDESLLDELEDEATWVLNAINQVRSLTVIV